MLQAMKPELYADLEKDVNGILKESKTTINEFMNDVFTLLKQQGIVIDDIEGRPKSLSSIRSKQVSKSMDAASKVGFSGLVGMQPGNCYFMFEMML